MLCIHEDVDATRLGAHGVRILFHSLSLMPRAALGPEWTRGQQVLNGQSFVTFLPWQGAQPAVGPRLLKDSVSQVRNVCSLKSALLVVGFPILYLRDGSDSGKPFKVWLK